MSLQTCPCCGKENSFWKIYKEINFKHRFHGCISNCSHCNKSMKLEKKNKEMTFMKKVCEGILWFLPAIIIIFLVATMKMHFITGILLITLFHFIAMYYLIKKYNFTK